MSIITKTDSYKIGGHWNMLPEGTEAVYTYGESRSGAKFPYTVFVGLQYLLKEYFAGSVVNERMILEAQELVEGHLGSKKHFDAGMWYHILNKHDGRLPIRIKAVPEGTPVPTGNVLMTIENTDPLCAPLTNALESNLLHIWHPSTVATLSRETFRMIKRYLKESSDNLGGLPFMLHDFGYRGVSSDESAALGGFGHLVNGLGTDTIPALEMARDYYNALVNSIAYSVPATEHSIMTARGRDGEEQVVGELIAKYPTGILSVVEDSYDAYNFVTNIVCRKFKTAILNRQPDATGNCAFVIRPDSTTSIHKTPQELVVWILEELWNNGFQGQNNSKGYWVLDKHVRVLWGDGIDKDGIDRILAATLDAGFSAENLVFGMGGGLLQKINRDTQRFAFKCSAQKRNGVWHDVFKDPCDTSKRSKAGRLKLTRRFGAHGASYETLSNDTGYSQDLLETVFENGELIKEYSLADLRKNAELNDAEQWIE